MKNSMLCNRSPNWSRISKGNQLQHRLQQNWQRVYVTLRATWLSNCALPSLSTYATQWPLHNASLTYGVLYSRELNHSCQNCHAMLPATSSRYNDLSRQRLVTVRLLLQQSSYPLFILRLSFYQALVFRGQAQSWGLFGVRRQDELNGETVTRLASIEGRLRAQAAAQEYVQSKVICGSVAVSSVAVRQSQLQQGWHAYSVLESTLPPYYHTTFLLLIWTRREQLSVF
jgi:hypothetical protein